MLARRTLIVLLTNMAGALGGVAALWAIGRYMGPAPFGMLAFALSVVGLASFLARMGLDIAHRKRISEGQDLATCMGTYTWLKVGLVLVFAGLTFAAATAWQRMFGFFDATSYPVLLLALCYLVFMEVRLVPTATFDALLQIARAQSSILVEHAVRTPLILLAALLYAAAAGQWVPLPSAFLAALPDRTLSVRDGALLLTAAYLVAMAASTAWSWWQIWRARVPFGRFDRTLARSYVRFAAPSAFLAAAITVSLELDRFLIGYFWDASQVGFYYSAQRILSLAIILPTAAASILFPMVSDLAAKGIHEGVRVVASTAQRALTLVMAFLAMLLAVFAQEGIRILQTATFDASAPILTILALEAIVMSMFALGQSIVLGYDRPGAAARIGLVTVGVNAVLNLLLIPASILGVPLAGLHGVGAAIATVVSQGIGLFLLQREVHRLVGASPIGWSTAKHLVAAIAVGGLLHTAKAPFAITRFHELAAWGILGLLLYVGLLWLLREVGRRDLRLLLDLANPSKLAAHVRDEFRTDRE